eukprot:scaffold766_cov179-Amphora_coffeaeformis.AAC.17
MNDDDYIAVLREELDEITAELEQARAYREKRRKLVEVLKEERKALETQKEERIKRSEVLLRLEGLEEKYEKLKKERKLALSQVTIAVKSCNRLLIATGRPPLDEPLQGRVLPKDELRKKKKEDDEASLSKSLPALSFVSPMVMSPAGVHGSSVSQHSKIATILSHSCHSAASIKNCNASESKVALNSILRKKTAASPVCPKKLAGRSKRRPGSQKHSKTKFKEEKADEEEKKHVKIDGDGDMTNFLDAIGYYSPSEEGEE